MTAPDPEPAPDPMDTFDEIAAQFRATMARALELADMLTVVLREATGHEIPTADVLALMLVPPPQEPEGENQ